MKILAIDTSGLVASVALLEGTQIICEYMTNYKKNHSVTLMPMLHEITRAVDLKFEELSLIAVSSGPGSFTGIRIGSATAKGMAHALNIPIAGIPTLEVLANNIGPTDCVICPMMDARRSQVYTALYSYVGPEIHPITEMMAIAIDELLPILLEQNKPIIFLGDGVQPNLESLKKGIADDRLIIAPPHLQLQRGAALATLALRYARNNQLEDYLTHEPIYLRKSQAEREYEEKNNPGAL